MTTQESREQEIKRLNAEKVKQIALCHFYSYYVRHNMSDMLAYVGEDVTWLGSQSNFVAHNRQEFENLLEREIKKVPKQCVMKVISADVSQVSGNCYQVTGELELRLPVQDNVYYTNLRFSMMICKEDGKFSIVSIHTSAIRKTALWDDTQVLKERQKQFSEEGGENIQDPVTGVLQLGAFKERAARQLEDISKEKNYALICTDICNFERVNNLYGMQKADKLLADTAKMIMASSKCILLCCRSVADHFVALACYQDFSTFRNMLNELCNRFVVEIGNEYSDAYPRLGIGVYRIDKEHPPIQKMVEYANLARKSLRTNTTSHIAVYDERVYTQLIRAGKIEQSMKNAMAQHEFKAFIQPKYNLEPVQAEGGIRVFDVEFLKAVREFCTKNDILMIVDDIQIGCCRSGSFFSFERAGIQPDIVVMSKSIGGIGMPMSIVLHKPEIDVWKPGEHNGTFRGNQLSFVAGKAAIEYLLENNVEAETKRKGEIVKNFVEKEILPLNDKLELRGIGLMWGIDCSKIDSALASKLSDLCFTKNLICEVAGRNGSVLKIMPALVIEDELLLKGLNIVKEAFKKLLADY